MFKTISVRLTDWFARPSRRQSRASAPVEAQLLEDRTLLAGNVLATMQGDNLVLTGDSKANKLSVTTIGNSVQVLGVGGTKINNSPFVLIPGDMGGNLKFKLKGGDDRLVVVADVGGDIVGRTGPGADVFELTSDVGGDLNVNVGSAVSGSQDVVVIAATSIQGSVKVKGTAGRQHVVVNASEIAGAASFSLGGGHDLFEVSTTTFGSLTANGGGGSNDVFVFAGLVNPPSRGFETVI